MDAAQSVYSLSLIAAFVAGMVALFAPCCISYLLPAYLGNVFKEKKQVLWMTIIYSLGIFTVMFPVVLGAKILSTLLFRVHDQMYIAGGILMLLVAVVSLLGFKLPMPHFASQSNGNNSWSTFILGIISGLTSACCAPVLIGVMTLSSLSPSIIQAVLVGIFYVLGMVTPLYLAAALIHKKNILEKPILKKKLTTISFGPKKYPVFVSNLIAFLIFFVTGWILIFMTMAGKLSMGEKEEKAAAMITATAEKVTSTVGNNPLINGVFLMAATIGLFLFIKKASNRKAGDGCCHED